MRKRRCLFILAVLALFVVSCKKEPGGGGSSSTNTAAIGGKWLTIKMHTQVYTTAGAKVKDSTEVFANDFIPNVDAWYETYDPDGKGAIIPYTGSTSAHPDTSEWYTYKVANNAITTYEFGDITSPQVSQILSVSATSMELEDKYASMPSSGWGFDENITYNWVQDITYQKQ